MIVTSCTWKSRDGFTAVPKNLGIGSQTLHPSTTLTRCYAGGPDGEAVSYFAGSALNRISWHERKTFGVRADRITAVMRTGSEDRNDNDDDDDDINDINDSNADNDLNNYNSDSDDSNMVIMKGIIIETT